MQSLAILPFRNASRDPTLDWMGSSFADMLSTGIGESAQLRTVAGVARLIGESDHT
jgi:eukaryotic-like serine/threonine-protein kinase